MVRSTGRPRGTRAVGRILTLLALTLVSLTATARAASVYGTALDPEGKPVIGQSFVVFGPKGKALKTVATDDHGHFSVFLQPGVYRVALGADWEGTIESLPDPYQQDLRFRVRAGE